MFGHSRFYLQGVSGLWKNETVHEMHLPSRFYFNVVMLTHQCPSRTEVCSF